MAERTPIIPPGGSSNPAFSPGVRVGDFLFVSGNVGADSSGNLASDCEAQSRQTMVNIRRIVEAAGATMQDVVKITCFLTNMNDYAAYSKVRAETWPSSPPASSTVAVAALVRPEFLVEVEAVVHVPS